MALAAHKFWRNLLGKPKTAVSYGIRKVFAVMLTFHFVCFCWIFFRNSTFEASVTMIRQVFTAFHPEVLGQLIEGYWKVFVLMGIGYLLHFALMAGKTLVVVEWCDCLYWERHYCWWH